MCRSEWSSSRAVAESTLALAMLRRSYSRMRRSTRSWPPGCSTTFPISIGVEISRVLAPGGKLIAVMNSELHLDEARSRFGVSLIGRMSFTRENGETLLARHFASVERTDVDGGVTFPDAEAIRRYIRSMTDPGAANADRVPDDVGPVRAGVRVTVFVARSA